MRKYTVLLLYPDYMTDNFGQDTYMEQVVAYDPKDAVERARGECIAADVGDGEEGSSSIQEPEDLFVLMVIEGHHMDLNPEGGRG